MLAVPLHIVGKTQDGIDTIQQAAIPELFQHTPDALDGIVFAVVRWIVSQFHRHLELIGEIRDTFHKLGTTTVVLRSVVLVQDEGSDLRKAVSLGLPEIRQAVHDKVTGDLRRCEVQVQFVMVG